MVWCKLPHSLPLRNTSGCHGCEEERNRGDGNLLSNKQQCYQRYLGKGLNIIPIWRGRSHILFFILSPYGLLGRIAF